MKTDPKARFQGYTFYFKEGFCWSAVNGTRSTNELKTRLKQKSVTDVQGMSLINYSICVSTKYLVCLLNSEFINRYTEAYINSTVIFQINDARQIPILIPTKSELENFEQLFDEAMYGKINGDNDDRNISKILSKLDSMIEELYNLK